MYEACSSVNQPLASFPIWVAWRVAEYECAITSSCTSAVFSWMDWAMSGVSVTPLPSLNWAPFSGADSVSGEGLAALSLQNHGDVQKFIRAFSGDNRYIADYLIQEVLRTQRDAYANLNNQTLHYVNQGVTINQMQNVYKVPESLQRQWFARGYHGSFEHNSRAVINRYLALKERLLI